MPEVWRGQKSSTYSVSTLKAYFVYTFRHQITQFTPEFASNLGINLDRSRYKVCPEIEGRIRRIGD